MKVQPADPLFAHDTMPRVLARGFCNEGHRRDRYLYQTVFGLSGEVRSATL